ncbi:legumain [Clonorchis sinensis]|uniref:Legumain n=1 Tax=Clonorchis sinensis TaxID=79923 RepID=G7YUL9_CLOSI|nr:legumain [Clonorchis sinensis]
MKVSKVTADTLINHRDVLYTRGVVCIPLINYLHIAAPEDARALYAGVWWLIKRNMNRQFVSLGCSLTNGTDALRYSEEETKVAKLTQMNTTKGPKIRMSGNNDRPVDTLPKFHETRADVYHAYQVVRANKVPAENIITLAYDDIAKNPKNPFKGKVFHDYEHEDVYKGVVIDYRGKDVTAKNFLKVLRGDKTLEANRKKVLKSGPDDYVFIFYSGHGLDGLLTFPVGDVSLVNLGLCHGVERYPRLHVFEKKYKKLVMYVEACYAGSMFRDVLPSNMGVYVTTSSNPVEQSWSVFCLDKFIDVCLADEYSYAWITDSQYKDLKKRTLDQQYEEVDRRTEIVTNLVNVILNFVMNLNEQTRTIILAIRWTSVLYTDVRETVLEMMFIAQSDPSTRTPTRKSDMVRLNVQDIFYNLSMISHNFSSRFNQLGHIVKETFRDIVMDVTSHYKATLSGLSKRDELMCFEAVFDQFQTHCFTIQQVPEVAHHTTHLMELCKAGYEAQALIQSVHDVCS